MVSLQPKLNLKVSQKQILTPGLVQMVSVLALNKLELKEMINAELVENPVLDDTTGSLGQTVDNKRIAELPLVHGDPYTLIGLAPGVSFARDQRLDRPFEPTHIVGFSMDGVRSNRSDLMIDGVPSTATANANEVIASYVPPTDIIQEFTRA